MKDWQRFRADYLWNQFTANFSHSKDGLSSSASHNIFLSLPFLIFLVLLALLILTLRLVLRLKKTLEEDSVLLELTPPSHSEKSAYTTQQLFSTIHNLGRETTTLDKILGKKPRFSFEIVSTQNQGIRYLIRVRPDQVNNFKRNLLSYLPQINIKTVNEYLPENFEKLDSFHSKIVEYKLAKPFGYPLQRQDTLREHDPVAYITGMMTKLSPGELISFQIVLSPSRNKEVGTIAYKIRSNADVLDYLNKREQPIYLKIPFGIIGIIARVIKEVGEAIISAGQEAMASSPESVRRVRAYEMESKLRANGPKLQREFTTYEQDTIATIQDKIGQPLFDATLRLLVIVKDKQELKERIGGFSSSLSTFAVPSYQSLKAKRFLSI